LAKGRVPLATIQRMVNTQLNSFPDQTFDMENIVMELAKSDASGSKFFIRIETFRYLLMDSISERLNSLNVRRWRAEIENCVNEFPKDAKNREEDTRTVYAKLASYELLKQSAWLLELALWKAKIDASVSSNCQIRCQKKVKVCDGVSHKEQCRISCGADIVVRNVLPFLWPK
jgi:predicted ATP-dependent endonuclease of OLD family